MHTLSLDQAKKLSLTVLIRAGLAKPDAETLYNTMLWSSLRGHESHGIGRIPGTAEQIIKDSGIATRKMSITNQSSGTAVIDAEWTLGQLAAIEAAKLASQKARNTGIGAVSIKNALPMGSLGYYVEMISQNDMIGLQFARFGYPQSAPYGGSDKLFGTNPLAVSFPAGKERPIIVDMATTKIANLALTSLLAKGDPLPQGLVLDSEGSPTTDPARYRDGRNVVGSMANMTGDHKGFALQIIVELLGGVLSGQDLISNTKVGNQSLTIAINISSFCDIQDFKRQVDQRITSIKSGKKAKGFDEIYLPGEQGLRKEQGRRTGGIKLSDSEWESFLKFGKDNNVNIDDRLEK